MMQKFLLAAFAVGLAISPLFASASVGVGVGSGTIRVEEPLQPGRIYTIPALPVINTGDERSSYQVRVQYHESYKELRPPEDWFSYSPDGFTLDPRGVEVVIPTITVPVNAQSGEYFAFLQARPIVLNSPGTNIGIAAASKLYFRVGPAGLFQGFKNRIASLLQNNAPWSYIVLVVFVLAPLLVILQRVLHVNLQIGIRKKSAKKKRGAERSVKRHKKG